MRDKRSVWRLWTRRCGLMVAALALLTACGEEPKPELSGKLGPGAGGQALSTNPADYQTVPVTKSSGTVVGYADFDDSYLERVGPSSASEFDNLVDEATGAAIGINLTRITGRPDTPCRFQAAILARDEGYDIKKSGDRKNDHKLELYQVDLEKGGIFLSIYCFELRDEVGVAVQVITASPELIHSMQVHYLLNSVRKS